MYGDRDAVIYEGPYYGWSPLYGDCFLCFCYILFGSALEPEEENWKQIYEIKF